MDIAKYAHTKPKEMREIIRNGGWDYPTSGLCLGHVQGNMIVLPKDWAYDFLVFAQRNPKPCPILDITEPGKTEPVLVAPGADLSRDIPRYRVWENGKLVDEPTDVTKYWGEDMVGILLGCSFSFEGALIEAGIPIRHMNCGCNVPMFITNIPCTPAGRLSGPMVVSMRPVHYSKIPRAVLCTGRFPAVHGAPIHIGDPSQIGITDINKPNFGDPVEIRKDELPVFWACGVTPQAALMNSKPPFAITHAPGHMFICDGKDSDYAVL
ncbi:MAG: putative hydro-lyase [Synergistaceae bacterium]|nr:putative hydro-lyase [Synergistaceae bacterium]MBP9627305.1 putative hydro-lyase [Synergistaceae bacterium]